MYPICAPYRPEKQIKREWALMNLCEPIMHEMWIKYPDQKVQNMTVHFLCADNKINISITSCFGKVLDRDIKHLSDLPLVIEKSISEFTWVTDIPRSKPRAEHHQYVYSGPSARDYGLDDNDFEFF